MNVLNILRQQLNIVFKFSAVINGKSLIMENTEISLEALITNDRISKALAKTKQEISFPSGDLQIVTPDLYPVVFDYMRSDFLLSELLWKAVDFKVSSPECDMMMKKKVENNISLVLLSQENGEVMGVRFMSLVKSTDVMNIEEIKDEGLKKMLTFWSYYDELTKFFEHYKVKEAIHMFGLGVAYKYRQQGIATKLMAAAINFLRNLQIFPLPIKGEVTSIFGQRVYEKNGFEFLKEIYYEDYKVDGDVVIKNVGIHKSVKTYGMILK